MVSGTITIGPIQNNGRDFLVGDSLRLSTGGGTATKWTLFLLTNALKVAGLNPEVLGDEDVTWVKKVNH